MLHKNVIENKAGFRALEEFELAAVSGGHIDGQGDPSLLTVDGGPSIGYENVSGVDLNGLIDAHGVQLIDYDGDGITDEMVLHIDPNSSAGALGTGVLEIEGASGSAFGFSFSWDLIWLQINLPEIFNSLPQGDPNMPGINPGDPVGLVPSL
jgi:hypothetical protein